MVPEPGEKGEQEDLAAERGRRVDEAVAGEMEGDVGNRSGLRRAEAAEGVPGDGEDGLAVGLLAKPRCPLGLWRTVDLICVEVGRPIQVGRLTEAE